MEESQDLQQRSCSALAGQTAVQRVLGCLQQDEEMHTVHKYCKTRVGMHTDGQTDRHRPHPACDRATCSVC